MEVVEEHCQELIVMAQVYLTHYTHIGVCGNHTGWWKSLNFFAYITSSFIRIQFGLSKCQSRNRQQEPQAVLDIGNFYIQAMTGTNFYKYLGILQGTYAYRMQLLLKYKCIEYVLLDDVFAREFALFQLLSSCKFLPVFFRVSFGQIIPFNYFVQPWNSLFAFRFLILITFSYSS